MSDIAARQQQFQQCVEQHHEGLYRVAFRLTGRQAVAAELVQESYLHAWRGLSSLREPERMRAWLYAILRRQYLKMLRRPSPWLATDLEQTSADESGTLGDTVWLAEQTNGPSSHSQQAENRDLIQWAIERLDDRYRFPLLLQLMEDLSVEEISETLELPLGTVLSHLHRGKQKLREILAREMSDDA